jgi:predicted ester cyclase
MNIEENKKVVLRFNKEFMEGGNVEILKEIIAEKFVNRTAAPNVPTDVTGIIAYVGAMQKAFPDMHIEIHDQFGENDLVCTRKTIHGTHLGEIMGHAPSGKKVQINVIDIVRVKDGKYVEHWGRNDFAQVLQQL